MQLVCHKCGNKIAFDAGAKPGRRDACAQCGMDLHSCLNCRHYDRSAYRECRETIRELVREKDRANFCDLYAIRDGQSSTPLAHNDANSLLKAAEALFKKKI